jgi:hypothetical protein
MRPFTPAHKSGRGSGRKSGVGEAGGRENRPCRQKGLGRQAGREAHHGAGLRASEGERGLIGQRIGLGARRAGGSGLDDEFARAPRRLKRAEPGAIDGLLFLQNGGAPGGRRMARNR